MPESENFEAFTISHPETGQAYGAAALPGELDVYEQALIVNNFFDMIRKSHPTELGIEVNEKTGASSIRLPLVEFIPFDSFNEAQEFVLMTTVTSMSSEHMASFKRGVTDSILENIGDALQEQPLPPLAEEQRAELAHRVNTCSGAIDITDEADMDRLFDYPDQHTVLAEDDGSDEPPLTFLP